MILTSDKAAFAVEFLDLPKATQIDSATWEAFQLSFLNNESRFGIDLKSRQIGWSWIAALDAVTDAILYPGTPHVFVSINLDEAKEKIRYARDIIDAFDEPVRPKLIQDSQTSIELTNGSRLISHPCRPVRGKPRTRVYLDELAHYKEGLDRQIYTAALPSTTKGDGYIRIGTSPLGARGLAWEIYTEAMRPYPGYTSNRRVIPWWYIVSFCKDIKSAAAFIGSTEERVSRFGTRPIVEIFENMFLEDFQQEFECAWVDESSAWISWETIKKNQQEGLLYFRAKNTDEAIGLIEPIQQAIQSGQIEPVLCGGLDIGRKHDLTEFVGLGKATTDQLPLRIAISLSNVKFDDQQSCFEQLITRLPFTQILVDQNGIGMQLAENLGRTGKATGIDFTNASKELWAIEARLQAERGKVPIPLDRDLAYQIHSIKKKVTAAKNNVFDTERNEKHHADKFWAWALGIWAGKSGASADEAIATVKRKLAEMRQ